MYVRWPSDLVVGRTRNLLGIRNVQFPATWRLPAVKRVDVCAVRLSSFTWRMTYTSVLRYHHHHLPREGCPVSTSSGHSRSIAWPWLLVAFMSCGWVTWRLSFNRKQVAGQRCRSFDGEFMLRKNTRVHTHTHEVSKCCTASLIWQISLSAMEWNSSSDRVVRPDDRFHLMLVKLSNDSVMLQCPPGETFNKLEAECSRWVECLMMLDHAGQGVRHDWQYHSDLC